MGKKTVQNRALSVKQPFAEQIMTGKKKIEYRSVPTDKRERVYIYATKSPRKDVLKKLGKKPSDYSLGVIIGTVEIVSCKWKNGEYQWGLANPQRLKKPQKPDGQPMPVWFKPFKDKK